MGLWLEFSWDFLVAPMLIHAISMIFLWDFCGIPLGFPWYFYDIALGLLLDFYGMPMVFLWYFYWIPMVSIGCLWDIQGISMMFL